MNRDEAIKIIDKLKGELPLVIEEHSTVSKRREAYRLAIAALETLELLGEVLHGLEVEHRPVRDELSGELDYLHEGNADAYEMAQLLVADPDALHAEAKRLGIE